jgi:hypothetical protein
LDFAHHDPNGDVSITWVLAECVLSKPVSKVSVRGENYDDIELTFTQMELRTNGRSVYSIGMWP